MSVMRAILFDTLAYSKRLIAAGFTKEQAEVQAESIAEVINDNLATKRDLEDLRVATKNDLDVLQMATKNDLDAHRLATKRDFEELHKDIASDMKHLEYKMTIKLGSLMAAAIAIVATLVKLL